MGSMRPMCTMALLSGPCSEASDVEQASSARLFECDEASVLAESGTYIY